MSKHPLTEAEIEALRELLPLIPALKEEAEFEAAKTILFKRWSGRWSKWSSLILASAALLAAMSVIFAFGKSALEGLLALLKALVGDQPKL